MSKFIQDGTGVIVSVSDEKDERFAVGWKPAGEPEEKATTKRSSKK